MDTNNPTGLTLPTISNITTFDPTHQSELTQHSQYKVQPDDNPLTRPQEVDMIQLKFRTYKPYSKQLKVGQYQVENNDKTNYTPSNSNPARQSHHPIDETDEQWIAEEIEPMLRVGERFHHADFLTSFPTEHNPTWDLKRDLKGDMFLLDQRTQEAIDTMVQQRLLRQDLDVVNQP